MMLRVLVPVLAMVVSLQGPGAARAADAQIVDHSGKWESGYGATFYNVVGTVKNTGDGPLAYVVLQVSALDGTGQVIGTTRAFNESAEILSLPGMTPDEATAKGKLTPFAPGTTQRFRASFLKEDAPGLTGHRVEVAKAVAGD